MKRTGKHAEKKSFRRLFAFVMITIAVSLIVLFTFGSLTMARDNGTETVHTKYYKTIEIQSGDSLWNIADENMSGEYRNEKEYIQEVMSINGLSSDEITSGMSLVIPYYE